MKANNKPGISIVTPTHGRVKLLQKMLESINASRLLYEGQTEVIIIDSSILAECKEIEQICNRMGATYHYMENNVREKRNWGVLHSRYPIVLFIDSDCRADINLIAEHAEVYSQEGSYLIGGVVGLTHFVGDENWIWKVIKSSSTLNAFSYPELYKIVPWGPTCNMSYRREIIVELGLFDDHFPFPLGGDDVDLGLRVTDAGFQLVTNKNAIVEHEKETWKGPLLIGKREFRWGRMHFHLLQKHQHRLFFNPPTVPIIYLFLWLLLSPFLFTGHILSWFIFPIFWLILDLVIETLFLKSKLVGVSEKFFCVLGTCILSLVFQTGCLLEGLRNGSLLHIFNDITYCPPSPTGRNRGIAHIWAVMLSLMGSFLLFIIIPFSLKIL